MPRGLRRPLIAWYIARMRGAILILVGLTACPASPTPAPTPSSPAPTPTPTPTETAELTSTDACTTDSDCVVTNFAGCCACPGCQQGAPSARSTASLTAAQQQCAVIRCDMDRCKTMLCKPGELADRFAAACRANVCVGVRK